jgi:hypothetical protein
MKTGEDKFGDSLGKWQIRAPKSVHRERQAWQDKLKKNARP